MLRAQVQKTLIQLDRQTDNKGYAIRVYLEGTGMHFFEGYPRPWISDQETVLMLEQRDRALPVFIDIGAIVAIELAP